MQVEYGMAVSAAEAFGPAAVTSKETDRVMLITLLTGRLSLATCKALSFR
jgi:hypothetical protein